MATMTSASCRMTCSLVFCLLVVQADKPSQHVEACRVSESVMCVCVRVMYVWSRLRGQPILHGP